MTPQECISGVQQARSGLRAAAQRHLRGSAESLEAAAPAVQDAIQAVQALQQVLGASSSPAERQAALGALAELRRELDALRGRVAYGAAYHAAWARILSGMAGYDANGKSSLAPPSRLNLHG